MMDSGDSSCLYARLGVGLTAPEVDIKQAYRRLARQWHPDRHRGDDTAKTRFQEIAEAYEVLADSSKRKHYDLRLIHLLDVEDYLSRYQELILTPNGLNMAPPAQAPWQEQPSEGAPSALQQQMLRA